MKRRLWLLFAVITAISFMTISVISCDDPPPPASVEFEITSPYAEVNWGTFGQFKAAQHVHTTNSDGSGTMEQVANAHYQLNYDILAITDHVWKGESPRQYLNLVTRVPTQETWPNFNSSLSPVPLTFINAARLAEFETGTATSSTRPANRPMLMIRGSAEFAFPDGEEMNVFFLPDNVTPPNAWDVSIADGIQRVQNAGAICFINHPGRTTNAQNFRVANSKDRVPGTAGVLPPNDPANPSNMFSWIMKYANLYMQFPATTLTGMEVFNRRDVDSLHDRVLWDNVNTFTIPEGRYVWGYGNDDLHSYAISTSGGNGLQINYNMFVMPENTPENFRTAMVKGHSYIVTVCAFNEGIDMPAANAGSERPIITSVTTGENTITITAQNATSIDWISEGRKIHTTTITDGSGTITLNDPAIVNQVGAFVRANIIGPSGMAVIQPIGTKRK